MKLAGEKSSPLPACGERKCRRSEFSGNQRIAAAAQWMRLGNEILSFISTTMIFGTPVDITLSELAVETFFPADDITAERMRSIAADLK